MKKPSIITNSYFFSLFSIIKIFCLLPLVSKHVVFSFSWTHIKTVFSCSLSDVQDFSVHRSKPCSRVDLKKPFHLSKVIFDPWSCILVLKDPWFMDPWIPRSILMIIVFGKVTPDRPSSWWSPSWKELASDNPLTITNSSIQIQRSSKFQMSAHLCCSERHPDPNMVCM